MTARRSRSTPDSAAPDPQGPKGATASKGRTGRTGPDGAGDAPGGGPADAPPPTFEQALSRLEAIVDQLEQGDLELEASLAAFEEGVALSRHCAAQLEAAEQRVEVLVRESGQWTTRPFDAPEPDDPDEEEDEESV